MMGIAAIAGIMAMLAANQPRTASSTIANQEARLGSAPQRILSDNEPIATHVVSVRPRFAE